MDLKIGEGRKPSHQHICVLKELKSGPAHGYGIFVSLERKNISVDSDTIYETLRWLKERGYARQMTQHVDGKIRKSYELTKEGLHYAERAIVDFEIEEYIAMKKPGDL